MSEENVPKLRLKPKLAAEPVYVPPPPPVPSAEEFPPPPPAVPEEAKVVRLKPKLAATLTPSIEPTAPVESPPNPPELSSFGSTFPPPLTRSIAPEPAQEIPKPEAKFSLKPKAAVAAFPPPFSPPPPVAPGPPQIPIPPPAYIGAETAQPIIAVPVQKTAAPFPPPPGNFPRPPVAAGKPTPPWAQSDGSAPRKKNFILIGGGVMMVLLVLGGVFFGYRKFTAEPPPAPAKPSPVVALPKSQPTVVQAPAEKPVQPAPVAENNAPADSAATPTAVPSPKPAAAPEPDPVEVAPPPPPSDAFKAWVDGIRVGGVRGGATTRVFIGGTAYAAGEVVNAQLGIVFDSYNAETRHLIFKDKTGAKVERRN